MYELGAKFAPYCQIFLRLPLHHSEASIWTDACIITLQHCTITYCRSARTATWWPTAATDAGWRAPRSTGWSAWSSAGLNITLSHPGLDLHIILDRAPRDYPWVIICGWLSGSGSGSAVRACTGWSAGLWAGRGARPASPSAGITSWTTPRSSRSVPSAHARL